MPHLFERIGFILVAHAESLYMSMPANSTRVNV